MITREHVADLQPGDVVEMRSAEDVLIRGRLMSYRGPAGDQWEGLSLGPGLVLRRTNGGVAQGWLDGGWSLTVVSRAPRPLYVNHPRTASVPGDVVRDADNDWDRRTWMFHNNGKGPCWLRVVAPKNGSPIIDARERREHLPPHLRLLVDGETGRCVP